jgi:YfiH family protein
MEFVKLFTDVAGLQAATTTVGMNVCHYAGADIESVKADRQRLAEFFGVSVDDVFIPVQTHCTNVGTPGEDLANTDAMVCASAGKVIGVNTADCLPLLLADMEAKVIAAVHCGWRGTVANIVSNAVNKMIDQGASPARMIAAMGPCIGTECFEVGEEVAVQFQEETVVRTYAKPHVDLGEAVSLQLVALGLSRERIAKPIACSVCDKRFYSVRRDGRDLPYRTFTAIKLL